ncbi:MAG: hypothetical protein ACLUGB_02700 [Bacilli bacterium]
MKIITIFLIAVSLSMDAFSLALIYGTQGIAKKRQTIIIIDSRSISFHNAINRCNNRKFNNKQNSNKY